MTTNTTSSVNSTEKPAAINTSVNDIDRSSPLSPGRNIAFQPNSRIPTSRSLDIDDYFTGPLDIHKHSKWPFFMRIHGSVLPKMILPLLFVGGWATAITCISVFVHSLAVNTVLLTVLGFVVGLALSFRCSTAYERYTDGRKYWADLTLTSRNLARLIWIHAGERHAESPEQGKADLLAKLTAINLINAFAVALKHRLRFEPAVDYPDLAPYVSHLTNTMVVNADQAALHVHKPTPWKAAGERLGVSFAQSNPRKVIKRSKENLGNLPLEILTYLQSYAAQLFHNKTMTDGAPQMLILTDIRTLADVLGGCERVLNTPLPIAYNISISQITWTYIMVLPFQLVQSLKWIAIPASMIAAYIILGLAIIGREVENPFGNDVNDLNLDGYCRDLSSDLDILTSNPAPSLEEFLKDPENKPLFPLSVTSYDGWEGRSLEDIRAALREKVTDKAKDIQLQRANIMLEMARGSSDV